jgi:tetratricopeptide (TPR) repeat protein
MNTENIDNLLTSLDLSQKARLELFLIHIFEKQKLNPEKYKTDVIFETFAAHPKFFNILGDFYQKERDLLAALQNYQQSLILDPSNYWSNFHIASIYRQYLINRKFSELNLKRDILIDKIIEIYQYLLKIYPNDEHSLKALSKFYSHIGHIEDAISINKTLVSLVQYKSEHKTLNESRSSTKNILKFMIIGSMKSGTTSLFEAISNHPDFVRPIVKEIHFFSEFFYRGEDWYFSHFPTLPPPVFTGEASTSYLDYLEVPERIQKSGFDLKFITILRDPIQRLISNFYHFKSNFQLKKNQDIQQSITDQLNYLEKYQSYLVDISLGKESIDRDLLFFRDYNQFFIMRSLYPVFLKHWINVFSSEKILILEFSSFTRNPQLSLKKVFEFLEIRQLKLPDDSRYKSNVGQYRADQLSDELYQRLVKFLLPFYDILQHHYELDFQSS